MSKGKRAERGAARVYERAGYYTFRPQESKWGETDIFNLFDMLAIGQPPDPVHLVQVKSNRPEGITEWSIRALQYAPEGVKVRMMVRYDRQGWRVIDPVSDGYETVLDERETDRSIGADVEDYLTPGGNL